MGGKDLAVRLAEVMGVSAGEVIERVARIHCQGGHAETSVKFEYSGPLSCAAAAMLNGGFKSCSDGCLGLGDCTDCGECSRVCPQHIPLHLLNRKFIKDIDSLYGDFQAGETKSVYNGFGFHISNLVPDGHTIPFEVLAEDSSQVWTSGFYSTNNTVV